MTNYDFQLSATKHKNISFGEHTVAKLRQHEGEFSNFQLLQRKSPHIMLASTRVN
jgi:hypothetical protein